MTCPDTSSTDVGAAAPIHDPYLPVSAFIICKDEAGFIEDCIRSLKHFAEIVVVDSGSTDGTLDILARLSDAEGWPIRVISHGWLGYAGQKQFAIEQCRQPWCFNIDADERIDSDLHAALSGLIDAPATVVGWRLGRRAYLVGYGFAPLTTHERHVLRLVRRGRAAFDLKTAVHEGMVPDGPVGIAKRGRILNYRPLQIDEQILKENKYSTLKAEQRFAEGRKPQPWRLVVSPVLYFFRVYINNRFFLSGRAGFILAMTAAIYAFLTEAKVIQRHILAARPSHDDMDGEEL
ncbi:MAG: glycosyltransferase family 2 protein [Ancalomicrobiaceae bacterium]|nr:glycosyltransferase family 2 protein [Ancalomicrobiaceae bacterium]